MPTYNYLPGVIVNTLDGGLTASFAPRTMPSWSSALPAKDR